MARQMKDSGIEWIGEIPENWELQKGKYLYRQRSEKGNSIELQLLSPTQKYGVIPQSLYEIISGMKPVQLDAKADLEQFKSIYAGDFCISLRSFQGGFEYSQYNGVVSPAYQVFYRQSDTTYDAFYRYIFKEMGFIGYMNSFTKSFRDGKSIAFDDFAGTLLPVPPIAEQHRIAAFLDRKYAEIDAVIERTKATIEEYKKLKQAVITEAVTKGVRGPRPMKDSGIEWIGEIPEGWEVRKCKHISAFINGYAFDSADLVIDFRYPVIRIGDIKSGFVDFEHCQGVQWNQGLDNYKIQTNDILLAMSGATVGKVGLATPTNDSYINQRVGILRSNCYKYLFYALSTDCFIEYILLKASGSAQPNVSGIVCGNFPLPYPPDDEREEITVFLDEKCAALDNLIAKKTALLTELETYKKSLIYEYVTGKKEV